MALGLLGAAGVGVVLACAGRPAAPAGGGPPAASSTTPPPYAAAPRPRVPLAITADTLFWRAFHAGAYDEIPRVMTVLKAAYLQNPRDAQTAAHIAFLHSWRISERARLDTVPPTITDDVVLARKYFDQALAHAPHEDARFDGFDAVFRVAEGELHGDTALVADGLRRARAAIRAWPEFNWFTVGYTWSRRPDTSALFREGLEMQWQTMEACGRAPVDRANPASSVVSVPEAMADDPTRARACLNSWIAPHNVEGFFLNMGDMLVKAGDWRTGRKVYALAQGMKSYPAWSYRQVLEERIANAEQNVAVFRAPAGAGARIMLQSRFACAACHQADVP